MLEPPAIAQETIGAVLRDAYSLPAVALKFLPLGADLGTAVFRASAADGRSYFVKLRLGPFDEVAARLPRWLSERGISEVMAPLPARSGEPFVRTPGFTVLLYPFVAGRDAYEVVLSPAQWMVFGSAMRAIHDASLPATFLAHLPTETYSPRWRDQLRDFMHRSEITTYDDHAARQLSALLRERRADVLGLLDRAEGLARALQGECPPCVLCHTDLHAGNLLVADDGCLFIVDWDAPLLAPRERDLMYPGGGQGFLGRSAEEEEALFFSGYGAVDADVRALAYYRLERIAEDLAIFCSQLLGSPQGGPGEAESDREQALAWAMSNFRPGGVLDIALRTARKAEGL